MKKIRCSFKKGNLIRLRGNMGFVRFVRYDKPGFRVRPVSGKIKKEWGKRLLTFYPHEIKC